MQVSSCATIRRSMSFDAVSRFGAIASISSRNIMHGSCSWNQITTQSYDGHSKGPARDIKTSNGSSTLALKSKSAFCRLWRLVEFYCDAPLASMLNSTFVLSTFFPPVIEMKVDKMSTATFCRLWRQCGDDLWLRLDPSLLKHCWLIIVKGEHAI